MKIHDFSIGFRSAFWGVGHGNRFWKQIDSFLKDFENEIWGGFLKKFGGSLEKYGELFVCFTYLFCVCANSGLAAYSHIFAISCRLHSQSHNERSPLKLHSHVLCRCRDFSKKDVITRWTLTLSNSWCQALFWKTRRLVGAGKIYAYFLIRSLRVRIQVVRRIVAL